MEKLSTERKKSKRPFLYRVWKFLQVTATSIKGDSEFSILSEAGIFFYIKICSEPVLLDLELPQRYRPIAIMRLCETTGWVLVLGRDNDNLPICRTVLSPIKIFSQVQSEGNQENLLEL